jgi:hypothetical protein
MVPASRNFHMRHRAYEAAYGCPGERREQKQQAPDTRTFVKKPGLKPTIFARTLRFLVVIHKRGGLI